MTWEDLLVQRRVARGEPAEREEAEVLRALVRRDLGDARVDGVSNDGRFEHAYAAARALATLVIRAAGYRAKQPAAHFNTFLALEAADPDVFTEFSAYFNLCRARRNEVSYEGIEAITDTELEEVMRKVPEFQLVVEAWLARKHPGLI